MEVCVPVPRILIFIWKILQMAKYFVCR
jgi:hypothetical protein